MVQTLFIITESKYGDKCWTLVDSSALTRTLFDLVCNNIEALHSIKMGNLFKRFNKSSDVRIVTIVFTTVDCFAMQNLHLLAAGGYIRGF